MQQENRMTSTIPKISSSSGRSYLSAEQIWLGIQAFVKRVFDIFISISGLIFLSPLFLLIATLLKRESPGPVLYRGPRVGRGGNVFAIIKFRTMYERPESYRGPRVTGIGDKRITPLGQWLRNTKLNELPQLWNVLVGEMSFVGPRPEDPEIAATWPADTRREILSVRPGITSPASVAYHDEEQRLNASNVMDDYLEHILPDKLRLDRLYVRHHNILTDLDVIFWTFVILIPRLGKGPLPEGWLFGGPFTRFIRNYVSWFFIDFVLALLSVGTVGLLRRINEPFNLGLIPAIVMAVSLALLFSLFNTLFGLKSVSWSRAAPEDTMRLFFSCLLVLGFSAGLHSLPVSLALPPLDYVFVSSLVVLFSWVLVRYRFRLITGLASRWINLRRSGYGTGERVLIVGAGQGGSFATWLLRHSDFKRLYTVVGIVDDSPVKQGRRYDGTRVLGTVADISNLVKQHDIGVIFYAISRIPYADSERILSICRVTGAKVVMVSNLMKMLHGYLDSGNQYCYEACPFGEQNSLQVYKINDNVKLPTSND